MLARGPLVSAGMEKWRRMHIAEIDYQTFFGSAFSTQEAASAFIECVDKTPAKVSPAKIALHQAARMLWLADQIEDVATGRPALQILFHLIAAEAVSKITVGFQGEGESRKHVRLFFE